jgi:hypothetical protein
MFSPTRRLDPMFEWEPSSIPQEQLPFMRELARNPQ